MAQTASDGPIDAAVLVRLAEGTGGDPKFVLELIEQFVSDSPTLVATARAGLEQGDADAVRRAAHTLKSNAATFGARALSEASRDLEMAAKRGHLEAGPELAEAMAAELEIVRKALPAVWRGMSPTTSA